MNIIDIVILAWLAIGLILGYRKGFVKQLASVSGFIIGLIVARLLFASVGERLAPQLGTSVTVAQVVAFVGIWIVIPFVLNMVASLLTKALRVIHLGGVNRVLGAVLGVVLNLLWGGLFVNVAQYLDENDLLVSKEVKEASLLYHPTKEVTGAFLPAMKQFTQHIIK